MTALTEGRHAAEFLMSEGDGKISREQGVVASGRHLTPGTVIMLNGSSKIVAYDAATASDAIGVLLNDVDATSADVSFATYIARNAEVNGNLLTYPSGQSVMTYATLKTHGIIVR
jgi:hypothetical protein